MEVKVLSTPAAKVERARWAVARHRLFLLAGSQHYSVQSTKKKTTEGIEPTLAKRNSALPS